MSEYKFQYSGAIGLKWVEENMKSFVFPDITRKGDRISQDFKGALASVEGNPVGLVLGLADQTGKQFRVMSLRVKPEHRNHKVATRLMLTLEQALKSEGFEYMDLQYRSHWDSLPAVKNMLKRLKWGEPEFNLRICQSLIEQAFPVFHTRHELPEDYEFTVWGEVTEEEKNIIRKKHEESPWYPEEVSPFQLEHIIEPNVSVALRFKGEIIGWLVMHQITQETLEYTSLFVDDEHRTFKIGHLLMGEGIDRQAAQEKFPKFLFTVKAENTVMVRFIERNGPVNGMIVTDVFQSIKNL